MQDTHCLPVSNVFFLSFFLWSLSSTLFSVYSSSSFLSFFLSVFFCMSSEERSGLDRPFNPEFVFISMLVCSLSGTMPLFCYSKIQGPFLWKYTLSLQLHQWVPSLSLVLTLPLMGYLSGLTPNNIPTTRILRAKIPRESVYSIFWTAGPRNSGLLFFRIMGCQTNGFFVQWEIFQPIGVSE